MTPIVPAGISCRELVELVTAYLDGALDRETSRRMDGHLELCGYCAEYVEQERTTARLSAVAAAELELRPDRDALLIAFQEFRQAR